MALDDVERHPAVTPSGDDDMSHAIVRHDGERDRDFVQGVHCDISRMDSEPQSLADGQEGLFVDAAGRHGCQPAHLGLAERTPGLLGKEEQGAQQGVNRPALTPLSNLAGPISGPPSAVLETGHSPSAPRAFQKSEV
ncbi:hypothetical protein [Reyranella sp.]|uniref:hypothetical protein n=1 Tax=Reyranella sp. TaxID=1929291 RepID=UPI003D0E9ADA